MSQKKRTKHFRKLLACWLEALRATHAATTLETWENYCSAHYVPFFEDVDGITRKRCAAYLKEAAEALAADADAGQCGRYVLLVGQPEALRCAVKRVHALKRPRAPGGEG